MQVDAVEQHAPLGRVVEARQQTGDGRLARAGSTHQRDGRPGGDVEVDVVQHGATGAVLEADVIERDLTGRQ